MVEETAPSRDPAYRGSTRLRNPADSPRARIDLNGNQLLGVEAFQNEIHKAFSDLSQVFER